MAIFYFIVLGGLALIGAVTMVVLRVLRAQGSMSE
jgi:hypothetical protein